MSIEAIAFWIALTAALTIVGLVVAQGLKADFQFWPPPSAQSWQHRLFRGLFRIFFLGLIVVSITDFNSSNPSLWRFGVGGLLFTGGFGLALHWTGFLGWRNAFGEAEGLKTSGVFSWSRNPIYVVSIIGMAGWALIVGSTVLTILIVLWGALYLGAPFVEEPWLEQQYGEEFVCYKQHVPRFIGWRVMG